MVIDRNAVGRKIVMPGSAPWVHDVICGVCPTAISFVLVEASLGIVRVIVRFAETPVGEESAACARLAEALNLAGPAGVSWRVGPGLMLTGPRRLNDDSPAQQMNDMQDKAVAELERLRAENARLVRERDEAVAVEKKLRDASERGRRRMRDDYDAMARWVAGLDDLRWDSRDRIEKRAHVNRAAEHVRPDGVGVDNQTMDAKAFEECYGKPHVTATIHVTDDDARPVAANFANAANSDPPPLHLEKIRKSIESHPNLWPKWPAIHFERGDGAVRGTSLLGGETFPGALRASFDPCDEGSYERACEQIRMALQLRAEYQDTILRLKNKVHG